MSGFTFGGAAGGAGTSGPSQGGLFGTSGTPSTSSIFGQSTPATSKPATGSLFGGTTSGASPFGSATAGGSQPGLSFGASFGANTGSKPNSGTTTPSLFGANASTGSTPAGGLFGGQAGGTTSSAGTGGGMFGTAGAGTPLGGSGFSFGTKKDDAGASTPTSNANKAAPTQASSLFNLNSTSGGSPFGSTQNTSTAAPAGSTTPAPSKFSFNNSTTPAGPPPTDNGQAKPIFGSAPSGQQPGANMFGGAKPTDSTQPKPNTMFSGLNTGNSALSGGLFNTPTSTPASSGASTTATTAPASEAPKSAFTFPPAASTQGTQSSTPGPAPAPTLGGLFGGAKPTPTASAAPAASNLFAGLSGGATTTATSTSASTSAPLTKPLFGGLGTSTPASTSAAPGTTAPAATSSLFAQTATSSSAQPPPTSATTAPGATGTANPPAAGSQPLGASNAGPTPQQSRLKNKTMDEIITRWASDLLKYQKDFQDQAAKVATWDRLLVENGEKIQTLHDSTFEAERSTREIESQLSTVESQQAELTSWLDRYEADVDEMFARQVGPGENLQGPDQERERTYKIAEKLTDRLDEMGKNITSMIEAINDASSNVSKNAKTDDPVSLCDNNVERSAANDLQLSHIVRVLNSHLTQLQWIDQNAEVLQAKVTAAQKLGQSIPSNGHGGPLDDAAESFYRSYTGRR
jgi:nuclear pore complex protein Nup62